ncbi:MAG: hypothetical protein AB7F86_00520 [Bdellovibrionales bacterium]
MTSFDITVESYTAFFTASGGTFGALVGLLSMVYVYRVEGMRGNVERTLGRFEKYMLRGKKNNGGIAAEWTMQNILQAVDALSEHFAPKDHQNLKSAAETMVQLTKGLSRFKSRFQVSNGLAIGNLVFALLALAIPFSWIQGTGQLAVFGGLIFGGTALAAAVLFIRELTDETHYFHIDFED